MCPCLEIKNFHILFSDVKETIYIFFSYSHINLLILGITNKGLLLHEVVEGLGSSLTHVSPVERGAGTRFLADLLHALPRNTLNPQELTFLATFFIDRLKDHHSVVPNVIYAYIALVSRFLFFK